MNIIERIVKHLKLYQVWFHLFVNNYNPDLVDFEKCRLELERYNPDLKSYSSCEYPFYDNQLDVSIIVPAYNVQDYIDECLRSLINQKTIYRYEIIVINDGSSDSTLEIASKFKTDKLRIINRSNEGVSCARNVGIKNALGEYLIFCDADDYMKENAVQILLDTAKDTKADIVEGAYRYIYKSGRIGRVVKHRLFGSKMVDSFGMPWCKCIKRSLFRNICFPRNYWFEDSIIHQLILPLANRVIWINDVVYYYRINNNGITSSSAGNPRSIDSLWITVSLFNERQMLEIPLSVDYYKYILNMLRLGFHRTKLLPDSIRKAHYYLYADFVKRNFKQYRFSVRELDYINMQKLVDNISFVQYCNYFNKT